MTAFALLLKSCASDSSKKTGKQPKLVLLDNSLLVASLKFHMTLPLAAPQCRNFAFQPTTAVWRYLSVPAAL